MGSEVNTTQGQQPMQQELTQILAFTREQAFVIQFHRDANLQAGQFEGRVEHISSGASGISMQRTSWKRSLGKF